MVILSGVQVTVSNSLSDAGKDLLNVGAARRETSAYGIVHK